MLARFYQSKFENDIYNAWDHSPNVLGIMPTGSGKTFSMSNIIKDHKGPSCCIAHRQELVSQISIALARNDIAHRIIGPDNVIRNIINYHMDECGVSYYSPQSPTAVAGVDTLIRRQKELATWSNSVTKWVQDEAHHVLSGNKWGKAANMFPNAIGLGVTATPLRADGKGLSRETDGLFDYMIEGPAMRALINMGYLTDYRIIAPKTEDLYLDDIKIGASGDLIRDQQVKAFKKSKKIIGDIVKHYIQFANGKLGITFVPSVDIAKEVSAEFNRQGIPSEFVHAKTLDTDRTRVLNKFKNREILQLINVDLFGEGFDLPAVECVSMARKTESFALFCQQFGRGLRLMISPILMNAWDSYTNEQRKQFVSESQKPKAIIIDHVGNVDRHLVPDAPRVWTLARINKTSRTKTDDAIPVRTCENPTCLSVYERIYKKCPFCGEPIPAPESRSDPKFVDGDLIELDEQTLAKMRGEIAKVDKHPETLRAEQNAKHVATWKSNIHVSRHVEHQQMQDALRKSIEWWGGYQRSLGRSDSESYKLFYFKFGIDVLSAQSLSKKDALLLACKVNKHLGKLYS